MFNQIVFEETKEGKNMFGHNVREGSRRRGKESCAKGDSIIVG
jgi:hypothetical protein